jgi:hypothetical protein
VTRRAVDLLGIGDLHDPAEVHHGDPVRDVPDDGQVVRDEDVGQLELVLQVLEQVDHLRLDRHVQRRHRSSHTMSLGRRAMARAIPIRCRWPPENSLG